MIDMNRHGIVYKRARSFIHKVLDVHKLGEALTTRELRKLMIGFGLASDKLTIRSYFERLEIFGFLKKLGSSGKWVLRHPDIERLVSLENFETGKQLQKVVKTD